MEDATAFSRLLQLGMGRAVLHLEMHDAAPYREAILHACLHDLRFDRWFERLRGEYTLELVERSGERGYYRERVVSALSTRDGDDDLDHLYDLARCFAERGDDEMRAAMYDRFAENADRMVVSGAADIIDLDGLEGFTFVASRLGKVGLYAEDEWCYDYLLRLIEDRYGELDVRNHLDYIASRDIGIARYLGGVGHARTTGRQERSSQSDLRSLRYEDIRRSIRSEDGSISPGRLPYWGRVASDDDVDQAAEDLLVDEDEARLQRYLTIFRRRAFPLDPTRLLAFARGEDDELARWTLHALANVEHSAIRDLALDLLYDGRRRPGALNCLLANHREGDHEVAMEAVEVETDWDALHRFNFAIVDYYEAHPSLEWARVTLALYEKMPCSYCRERLVQALHGHGALPEHILRECAYDANPDLRHWARRKVRRGMIEG